MKYLLLCLLVLPLFAFENGVTYQCKSIYRADIKLAKEEQAKTYFEFYIKTDGSYLRTSAKRIYNLSSSMKKGRLYLHKTLSQGKILYYKMQFSDKNSMMKSVTVQGYGKLISEFVKCSKKSNKKKNNESKKNTNSPS